MRKRWTKNEPFLFVHHDCPQLLLTKQENFYFDIAATSFSLKDS